MDSARKIYIGLLICFAAVTSLQAQDLHFSQYFNTPMLVNPANTGFNPDYDYRVGGNYRNQWASVGNPYKTMSAWGDAKIFADRFENGWMGVGLSLMKDVAGSGNLSATTAVGSIAYHQMIGYNSLLSGGFSLGYVNKRVDVSKLTFDNQWNGRFFDVSIPPNEAFANSSVSYLDLQIGLNYAYFASDNLYFNAGVSIMHVNKPRESFFDPSVSDASVKRRITGFANASLKIEDLWIINPNLYVSKMGTAWETVIGFNANRNLSGDGTSQMIFGLYYRNADAIIPMIGYEVNDLKIILNYDATISTLSNLNGTRGAYELSVVKSGVFSNSLGRSVRCPTVKFGY
ncbi:PorP/SprF family type IX secretion system membrane protein [Sediminibacterium ginsengisoli]|uniref:Type IX secretion system membrane protein, PorP/SprF family n=1 Tax=Sediminibacterium ginsengisoli TaxID=413434 RepID=A0A1T4KR78_9BACT|nr:PorP/SprF family type IX secretion system membrane protein [Sediminibacterium ginsengisoli]SJZ44924.1 type IX secretion system membrane protein, PorP/SprF family [Sediminibacterium ginsengisoli]